MQQFCVLSVAIAAVAAYPSKSNATTRLPADAAGDTHSKVRCFSAEKQLFISSIRL
jgi:hypothetical protein